MRVIIKKDARQEILIHPESLLAFQDKMRGSSAIQSPRGIARFIII